MLTAYAPRLAQAAGPLLPYLDDPTITEIRVNSNHLLFVTRPGQAKEWVDTTYWPVAQILDSVLALVADMVGAEWRGSSPSLHAGLPGLGMRIEAGRPPMSPGVWMVVRKHPHGVITLSDFEHQGIVTAHQRAHLLRALSAPQTILIAGAVSSAKTTLANALLQHLLDSHDRIVLLEEDRELQCHARDVELLSTSDVPRITMADLCKTVLRMSPDRVVVGEVRDGAALDMLKAFHRGTAGLCTIHAASARETLTMLEQLVLEVSDTPQRHLIGEAVDMIGYMARQGGTWKMTELIEVHGYDGSQYRIQELT